MKFSFGASFSLWSCSEINTVRRPAFFSVPLPHHIVRVFPWDFCPIMFSANQLYHRLHRFLNECTCTTTISLGKNERKLNRRIEWVAPNMSIQKQKKIIIVHRLEDIGGFFFSIRTRGGCWAKASNIPLLLYHSGWRDLQRCRSNFALEMANNWCGAC